MDDLIGRWLAGDRAAGDELYQSYFLRVKEFVIKLGETVNDAEEVAQRAILAGLEGIQAGNRPDRLTYWILGIARNINARRTRLECRDDLSERSGLLPSSQTQTVRREMNGLLEKTLEGLTERDREMLDLLHRQNLSRKEVAERLDIPVGALHARCERAYARMRSTLSRHFTTLALTGLGRAPVTLEEIQALRPSFRQAVIARHLEDLSESEAALRAEVPVGTLRARLKSAYELLKCEAGADFAGAKEAWKKEKAAVRPASSGRSSTP